MTTISKAQQTRDRQNTEYINSDIRRKLAAFENEYLNSAVAFEFGSRKAAIRHLEDLIEQFPTRIITKENKYATVRDYQHRIDRIKHELQFDATITMKALVDSKKSYDLKVDKLVETLVTEGFGYSKYKVEEIKSRTSRLEFLISKDDKEVHARLIWVDAVEKTPHFRFITTTRQK